MNYYKKFFNGRASYIIEIKEKITIQNHVKIKTTKHQKTTKKKTQKDSITTVNRHGVGLWGNERIVVGVRVDKELYKAFKSVAERVFGSVCNPIEAFMAAVLACQKEAVNFGQTVSIDRIIIERNLRERRKLDFLVDRSVGGSGGRRVLFYDAKAGGVWREVAVEDGFEVNENGHLHGCECLKCRGNR